MLHQYEVLTVQHPRHWDSLPEFKMFQDFLESMPAINDACERVLGMTINIESRSTAPRSEDEMANVIKLNHAYREAVREKAKQTLNATKKPDTTTKKFLKTFQW